MSADDNKSQLWMIPVTLIITGLMILVIAMVLKEQIPVYELNDTDSVLDFFEVDE